MSDGTTAGMVPREDPVFAGSRSIGAAASFAQKHPGSAIAFVLGYAYLAGIMGFAGFDPTIAVVTARELDPTLVAFSTLAQFVPGMIVFFAFTQLVGVGGYASKEGDEAWGGILLCFVVIIAAGAVMPWYFMASFLPVAVAIFIWDRWFAEHPERTANPAVVAEANRRHQLLNRGTLATLLIGFPLWAGASLVPREVIALENTSEFTARVISSDSDEMVLLLSRPSELLRVPTESVLERQYCSMETRRTLIAMLGGTSSEHIKCPSQTRP